MENIRVKENKIIEFDVADFYPKSIETFDLSPFLFQGIALKEKDFRKDIKHFDWSGLKGDILRIHCSEDVILPAWVFPFIANKASQFKFVYESVNQDQFLASYYSSIFARMDWSSYLNQRVLLRGCSSLPIPSSVYTEAAFYLGKVVKKLSYGEACSQVPL